MGGNTMKWKWLVTQTLLVSLLLLVFISGINAEEKRRLVTGSEIKHMIEAILIKKGKANCVVEMIKDDNAIVCSGVTIRLLGAQSLKESFDKYDPRYDTVLAVSEEAKKFLEKLIPPGTKVLVEYEPGKMTVKGKYEFFGYVWKDDILVDKMLILEGYAEPSDSATVYKKELARAHESAILHRKGIWGKICFRDPFSNTYVCPQNSTPQTSQTSTH